MKPVRGAEWDAIKRRWIFPLPGKQKPRPSLKFQSKKRAKDSKEYARERKWFLADPANASCPVAASGLLSSPHLATTQIHHMKGRAGSLYLDKRFWLAVSAEGHSFIHANPKIALERGWMIYH